MFVFPVERHQALSAFVAASHSDEGQILTVWQASPAVANPKYSIPAVTTGGQMCSKNMPTAPRKFHMPTRSYVTPVTKEGPPGLAQACAAFGNFLPHRAPFPATVAVERDGVAPQEEGLWVRRFVTSVLGASCYERREEAGRHWAARVEKENARERLAQEGESVLQSALFWGGEHHDHDVDDDDDDDDDE